MKDNLGERMYTHGMCNHFTVSPRDSFLCECKELYIEGSLMKVKWKLLPVGFVSAKSFCSHLQALHVCVDDFMKYVTCISNLLIYRMKSCEILSYSKHLKPMFATIYRLNELFSSHSF